MSGRQHSPRRGRATRRVVLALVCLAACSAQARAEETGASNTARTVGRQGRDVEDPRRPSGFVTRVRVKDGDESVADALERSAGVEVRRTSSQGQTAYVGVRGGSSRQLTILLNGVPLDVPEGLGVDVGSLSVAGLDGLTILRGAAGAVHGAGGVTGAVELDTRAALRPRHDLAARLSLGSFGYQEIVAQGHHATRQRGVRAALMMRRAAGDFWFTDAQGTSARRVNNDHARAQLLTSGAWRHARGRLDATLMLDGGAQGVAGPSEFQRLFSKARAEDRRAVMGARWRGRNVAGGDRWTMDAALSGGMQRRHARYTNDAAILGGRFTSESHQQNATTRLTLTTHAALTKTQQNFARLELGADTLRYRRATSASTGASPSAPAVRSARHRLSLALSDEHTLWRGRLSVLGALRVEHLRDPSRAWTPLLPALGVLWRPLRHHPDALRLRANLARTWRAPALDELYLDTETVRGDPELRPERALAWDVGADTALWNNHIRLGLAAFQNDVEELILFLPVSAYLFQATNTGAARILGAEGTAALTPHRRVHLDLRYTLLDARLDTAPHAPLPGRPRHRLRGAITLDAARIRALGELRVLSAQLGASWRSAITLDTFGRLTNASFLDLSTNISAEITPWLTLDVAGQNLLNQRSALDTLQRPLPGRTFSLSARIKLPDASSSGQATP